MDELIVYLIRKTGWTLEYTTELVRNLGTDRLKILIEEMNYQDAIEYYGQAQLFGMLLANWASAHGKKKYRVTDFIGLPPQRKAAEIERLEDFNQAAEKIGLELPEEYVREIAKAG